jgi:hypothetical protein
MSNLSSALRASDKAPPETAMWWDYARRSAHAMWAGVPPPTLRVYGPVLAAGESAYLCAPAFYSRLIGGDGAYTPTPMFAFGPPAAMMGALAVQGFINHRRKVAAERKAATTWRFHQGVQVIATSLRLLCNTRQKGWLSFWYRQVTEFYPDLSNRMVTMGFGRSAPALRLAGPSTPALCLWSAWGILGRQWMTDPRLAPLLGEPSFSCSTRSPVGGAD